MLLLRAYASCLNVHTSPLLLGRCSDSGKAHMASPPPSSRAAAPEAGGGLWPGAGTAAVCSGAGQAPGEALVGSPRTDSWAQREEVGALAGGSVRGAGSFLKCSPSRRNSQSRGRTSRWGTAGSEWSGCARPSPWLAPHTPRTWKVQSTRPEHGRRDSVGRSLCLSFLFSVLPPVLCARVV